MHWTLWSYTRNKKVSVSPQSINSGSTFLASQNLYGIFVEIWKFCISNVWNLKCETSSVICCHGLCKANVINFTIWCVCVCDGRHLLKLVCLRMFEISTDGKLIPAYLIYVLFRMHFIFIEPTVHSMSKLQLPRHFGKLFIDLQSSSNGIQFNVIIVWSRWKCQQWLSCNENIGTLHMSPHDTILNTL